MKFSLNAHNTNNKKSCCSPTTARNHEQWSDIPVARSHARLSAPIPSFLRTTPIDTNFDSFRSVLFTECTRAYLRVKVAFYAFNNNRTCLPCTRTTANKQAREHWNEQSNPKRSEVTE